MVVYQGNMAQSKYQNKPPETDPKEMETYELPGKEFKIIFLKKLNVLQESINKQILGK